MTELNYLAKIGDKEITAADVEAAISSLTFLRHLLQR